MRRFTRQFTVALATAALVMAACVLAGLGWYYSERVWDGALAVNRVLLPPSDLEVVSVADGRITLQPLPGKTPRVFWQQEGVWGLVWVGGYGRIGSIVEADGGRVVREFSPLGGLPPVLTPTPGTPARLDSYAWHDSYAFWDDSARHVHKDVTYRAPLGKFPARFIGGSQDTWMVFVHGRSADRREGLRVLSVFIRAGFPSLLISYRNDVDAPVGPDGMHRFGETEWEDLEGAVRYAREQGAKDVILVGNSMGGAIVVSFLYRSPLAGHVRAVVLDAPLLDFEEAVDYGARQQDLPGIVTWAGKTVAAWRFNIDWAQWDYLPEASKLSVPILLIHGTADETVPVESSDALAAARPDLVTYVKFPGAHHTRSWNQNPALYEQTVRDFLSRLGY